MPAPRKFKVGDRVWRKYPVRYLQNEYEVAGVIDRSYLLRAVYEDSRGHEEKYSFKKAEAEFHNCEEHEDSLYVGRHRYKIIARIERVDAATLRRVAEVIGYEGDQ